MDGFRLDDQDRRLIREAAVVLLLREEGFSAAEIADVIGLDPGDVAGWFDVWDEINVRDRVETVVGMVDPVALAAVKVAALEPRLRPFLPADLHADLWANPDGDMLKRVVDHLFTLLYNLYAYMPYDSSKLRHEPGVMPVPEWVTGTLMFVDLVGFTPLIEAHIGAGRDGGRALLGVLSAYFRRLIEVVTVSGGRLLEFTGDAILVHFPANVKVRRDPREALHTTLNRAVRTGLRMQHAMQDQEALAGLHIRVGIHCGRVLIADLGTPRRRERVLLGWDVGEAKRAESHSAPGRVALSKAAYEELLAFDELTGRGLFNFEQAETPGYWFVVDDLTDKELGDSEWSSILPGVRRLRRSIMDLSPAHLLTRITEVVTHMEPLASYVPAPVLALLVEHANARHVPPEFSTPTVLFVNLIGLSEAADDCAPGEEQVLAAAFSRLFAQINAVVECLGGTCKKVTYHLRGSDIMIFFGVPVAHTDDPLRAVRAALMIRDLIAGAEPITVGGRVVQPSCRIGLSLGPVFAAEIGDTMSRREFNIIGDDVNIAARLMAYRDTPNEILLTGAVQRSIRGLAVCDQLGTLALKGKTESIPVYVLRALREV
ncbi:MAG: adenylate/guanylate cyclase domain-containing protein [Anaerolineae bacterium]|nr:adenylate/guanylate cyclase domain-containing protein [Anaerolineae bacterium]